MDNAARVMDRRLDQEQTNPSSPRDNNSSSSSSSSSTSSYSPDLPSRLHDSLSSPSPSNLPSPPSSSLRSNSQDRDQDNRSNSDQLANSNSNIEPILDCTSTPTFTNKQCINSIDNNNTHLATNSSTNIDYNTHYTLNNHNNHIHSINQQDFTPTEIPDGAAQANVSTPLDSVVLESGTGTALEPASEPFQSFQSFFSPLQSTHVNFEQMSMANYPLSSSIVSSTTENAQSTVNDPRANLLISSRPRYTVRSFRGPNNPSPTRITGEALSMGSIVDANHSASSLNRIGSPDSDPSTLGTIMSIPSQIPETDSEELEKERLDLQLKGRGHISIGYPSDLGTNRWATTTAGGRQHSLGMEGISDDRGDRIPGRHSISKPRTSTSPAVTSSPVVISGSSEMLPLSEFLSQSADDDKVDNQSTEGLGSRTDDTPELNYPMYSSFSTPSAPGLPGRVPITSASGEFSGFQQFPSLHKDVKYSDRSGVSTQAHAGVISSSHSHETHPSGTDSCVAQDHDENDYLNQRKPLRNYKVFPGRNVFFCGGRIMTSHDFPAFVLAVMLVLVPTGLFHGFTSSYLWHRLSPAAPIVQAYVFIVAFSSMLKTSWTDPGIIPRGIDSDPPVDPPLERDPNSASFYPPQGLPRQKEVQVGMHTVRLKYCDTCKIYRPPRCSHCRQCDNCVEDEDHHCIWLNNCIGRRNYRYFLIFVTTMSIYAFLTSALCLTHLLLLYHDKRDSAENPNSVSFSKDAMAKAPVSVLVMLYSLIMGLAVGSLAGYHFWLATKNRTTHEQLTASMMRPHVVDNPFDRGNIFRNCAAVLCRPPTRSYIRRRDYTVA